VSVSVAYCPDAYGTVLPLRQFPELATNADTDSVFASDMS